MYGLYEPTEEEIIDCVNYNTVCSYGICDECIVMQNNFDKESFKDEKEKC